MSDAAIAVGQLRSIVERIERVSEEIKDLNTDKSEIFQEAKSHGYNVKVLKSVVRARAQDANERAEQDAIFDLYMNALNGASRARTQAEPKTPPLPKPEKPAKSNVVSIPTAAPARNAEEWDDPFGGTGAA